MVFKSAFFTSTDHFMYMTNSMYGILQTKNSIGEGSKLKLTKQASGGYTITSKKWPDYYVYAAKNRYLYGTKSPADSESNFYFQCFEFEFLANGYYSITRKYKSKDCPEYSVYTDTINKYAKAKSPKAATCDKDQLSRCWVLYDYDN